LHNTIFRQLDSRLSSLEPFIRDLPQLHGIAARGGPLKPMAGGVYKVNAAMCQDYKNAAYANHASNLGALMAHELSQKFNVPSFIVDPVSTDEMQPVAKISGVPGIQRQSRSHALNIKFCSYLASEELKINYENSRFITAHLGSGFSIAAVKNGKIIDVNDGLLGMGPFSVERAGSLPLAAMLELIFEKKKSKTELINLFSTQSGCAGYLGTNDLRQIEAKLKENKYARIYAAMIYQIHKEIGSMYAVLNGRIDALILTGGLLKSKKFGKAVCKNLDYLSRVIIYPGGFELEALAAGVYKILAGVEKARVYAS